MTEHMWLDLSREVLQIPMIITSICLHLREHGNVNWFMTCLIVPCTKPCTHSQSWTFHPPYTAGGIDFITNAWNYIDLHSHVFVLILMYVRHLIIKMIPQLYALFVNPDMTLCATFYFTVRVLSTHYCDVIMTSVASQITSLAVVYSIVYSDADQRKHQSSASLAFVRGIHRDWWIPAQRASNAENASIWWRHHEPKEQ